MKIFSDGKISLTNILKIFAFLIIALMLSGFGIGVASINEARQEKMAMSDINTTLGESGASQQTLNLINNFAAKYPKTKNIVIVDAENNILHSANKQIIGENTKFILEQDEIFRGIYNLKGSTVKFLTDPKNAVPHTFKFMAKNRGYIERNNLIRLDKPDNNMVEKYRGIISRGDTMFLNTYRAPQKGLSIHYISGDFRGNSLIRISFILDNLLRFISLLFWILTAVWVYRDSRKRGLNFAFWGIIAVLAGPIGLLIYLIARKNHTFCYVCNKKVSQSHNYCYNCGAELKTNCPKCGSKMNLDYKYCFECGKEKDTDLE